MENDNKLILDENEYPSLEKKKIQQFNMNK